MECEYFTRHCSINYCTLQLVAETIHQCYCNWLITNPMTRLLPRSCCQGVVAQELLPRRCCSGVVAKELLPRSCCPGVVAKELLPRSCCQGVVAQELLPRSFCKCALAIASVNEISYQRCGPADDIVWVLYIALKTGYQRALSNMGGRGLMLQPWSHCLCVTKYFLTLQIPV